MITQASLHKVLIIGCGPIRIGHTGAFDDAACQACGIFREEGLETVMVHCDPSSLAADADMAHRTYVVPLTVGTLTEVIRKEKPDALLPTVGGPTALRLAKALAAGGILDEYGIRLLGLRADRLALVDDPGAFFDMAAGLGLAVPEGREAGSTADAAAMAEKIGYPVFIRALEPGVAVRQGVAFNVEELRRLAHGGRLTVDAAVRFRIEPALSGDLEVEVALVRGGANRVQVVAVAEDLDPVGIHSGDSMIVSPPQTIDPAILDRIQASALKLTEALGITGCVSFKFAVQSTTGQILPLAMDMGIGRTAAFLAKAFGIPLAAIQARCALGLGPETLGFGEGTYGEIIKTGKTVAVRLPRWEFERFPGEVPQLNTCMKSTGAVMGLGHTFLQALLKAIRARSPHHPLPTHRSQAAPSDTDALMQRLVVPSPDRLALIHAALKNGATAEQITAVTGICLHWIRQLAELAELELELCQAGPAPLSPELADRTRRAGFDDALIARLLKISEDDAARLLSASTLKTGALPSSAIEPARIWFHTPAAGTAGPAPLGQSVLIVGPGATRIGQSVELDHSCAHAAKALRAAGRRVIIAGANPSSAGSISDIDRIYVEPLTPSDVITVCRAEQPDGVILEFGGFRAMDLAAQLSDAGFTVLGTSHDSTALCQDRLRFSALLTELGIPHPQIGMAHSPDAAMDLAETIGYPLLASATSNHQGRRRMIMMDARMLEQYVMTALVSADAPIWLEQFLEYAIEVEADALCDGRAVYIPAVMEHIELAGVHSGDTAMVVPPYSTPPRHVETVAAIIDKISRQLRVKGLLNTRFAVLNDTVYLLAVRPWACRTLPLISKICDVPMARRAVDIMLGTPLSEMDLPRRLLPHYTLRAPVFPFDTFTDADPLLGPRMCSTGQAMAMADGFAMAYFTAREAAGPALPIEGNVLITVTDADKPSILEPARLFKEMGFGIQATRGTHSFLKKNGIEAQLVKKLGFGRPDLADAIKTGEVALVINTPSGSQSQQDDAYIRKTANRYRVPNITTPAGALAAAKGIAARKRDSDGWRTLQSYVRDIR